MRRVHGFEKNEQTGQYEIRSNAELKELFEGRNIVEILKERRISWLGHV